MCLTPIARSVPLLCLHVSAGDTRWEKEEIGMASAEPVTGPRQPWQNHEATDLRVCRSTGRPVSLAYDVAGDPSRQPLVLLVAGLNQNLEMYPDGFCAGIRAMGFAVARFDNRDVGLSTHFDDLTPPSPLLTVVPNWLKGGPPKVPYTLDDMADDALALAEHILATHGGGHAGGYHVIGTSMGGMIAQLMALRIADKTRIRSVTLVMSHSGAPGVGEAALYPTKLLLLKQPKNTEKQTVIDFRVEMNFAIGWPYHLRNPRTEAFTRALVTRQMDRSEYRKGVQRQIAAITAAGPRDERLRAASLRGEFPPTLVMHGLDDRLVPPSGGYRLAQCIHGATLQVLPHWGHNFDPSLFAAQAAAIGDVLRLGEERAAAVRRA